MLAERLGNDEPTTQSTSSLFVCVVCQADLAPSEGISVHAGSIFSTSSKPWQGPFLCADCQNKKDAMEGKRPCGIKFTFLGGNIFIFGLDLGEDNKGLGGICKQPRLPSNIANTMPIG
ncbi:probable protein phosphatase 2C 15 [Mangifera indica]|uniref:probable protein phosphatase 2C 15 n=1 Tax=Mangifera indica TaxID=29780 RepID=UPI001CF9C0F8|nr:probable protein phosphatase 2C 15 [Mangifera indica]